MSGRGAQTKNIPSHPIVVDHPYTENTIVNTTTTSGKEGKIKLLSIMIDKIKLLFTK